MRNSDKSDKAIAMYPGTFDPITNGHIDIIKRASSIFGKIIVAVAITPSKNTFFSYDERIKLVKEATKEIVNVEVIGFDGLTVDLAHKLNLNVIIRGLRAISDFEYEFQMALTNYKIAKDIETVFFMSQPQYSYISSKLIKEIALLGGDISGFLPGVVSEAIKKKVEKINENSGR